MNLQQLITYISFIVLLTTNDTFKNKYNVILAKALDTPKKLTKTNTLTYLSTLYVALNTFLLENIKLLSRKERSYIKALKNLILQLKRYLKIQSAKEFPNIILNLGEKEFKLGVEELSKGKRMSKEIILLNKPYMFNYKVLQPSKKGKNTLNKKK